MVQKLVQKMVQKIVQKMVQGSNGPILILPYAILLHVLQVTLVWFVSTYH